ncbi:MLO-like protein 13 isoform X2 [Selaginella moellendorffii]|uniref:MLO-like protein 13 isoform X2 n=1 Tax=Selaginella moellendorffii TaxID=88036 RepID=UPI000D1C571A|nr:MLO-like protein 13 isoform X2 [Selaginella moellendorffii]|eukprot:XP_024524599.1 MLO-like protein 13 isoform X2 [Selaginella moellendorffii]
MAEEEKHVEGGSLEVTPTWAVALVCSIFVLASFGLVRAIHHLGRYLRRRKEKSLYQALDKIKEELMLLGFISLLLTVFQPVIASICMPHNFIEHMLPCKFDTKTLTLAGEAPHGAPNGTSETPSGHARRLLALNRRMLASESSKEAAETSKCFAKNKVPFVSREGLHKLHIFIFVLAVVHVVYSCLTLILGRYKVHGWSAWERRAQAEPQTETPSIKKRGKLVRQSTFLKKHANPKWISSDFLSWIVCFFRQFGRSVTYTEYQTLRLGFIRNHNLTPSFDFHRYLLRVLEDDFKKVVGISFYLWFFVVLFLLLNVSGWHTYFWIAFLPLGILLVVGAKLQNIIMALAVEIAEEQKNQSTVVVNLRDELFWFNRPKLILYLIHFVLFQNAFELAFFVWIWAAFGFDSCFMENLGFVITRLVIGVIVQVLCSYSTLPLYALVTQMGKHFKFGEDIQSVLTNLHAKAKKKSVHGGSGSGGGGETAATTAGAAAPAKPNLRMAAAAAAAAAAAKKSSQDPEDHAPQKTSELEMQQQKQHLDGEHEVNS